MALSTTTRLYHGLLDQLLEKLAICWTGTDTSASCKNVLTTSSRGTETYPIIIILKSFSIGFISHGLQKKAFVNIERMIKLYDKGVRFP